jgi:probable phosphoglycerate mutase
VALSKIQGSRSRELLQQATSHPSLLVHQLAETLLKANAMSETTRIILVRHGETDWNRIERFRGQADVPLNDTGLFQAAAAGRRVAAEWTPSAVYASPLSRAVQTAEAIASHFNLPVQAHPGLSDINYGEWQGLTPEQARQRSPVQAENWYHHPEQAVIPAGETLADLRARAMQTVNELAELHKGETIVLVGHTVINRIILLGIMGLGNERFWALKQEPCAINVFEVLKGDFVLVSLNDTCHLRN